MSTERRKADLVWWDLPDPDGEPYEDGSHDTLIEVEYPARYPLDRTKVTVAVDGVEGDWSAVEIRWFVEHAPEFLAQLGEDAPEDRAALPSPEGPEALK